jgi:hypothetical protein
MRSKVEVVGTLRSLAGFLEPIKYQTSAVDIMLPQAVLMPSAAFNGRNGHRSELEG